MGGATYGLPEKIKIKPELIADGLRYGKLSSMCVVSLTLKIFAIHFEADYSSFISTAEEKK